MLLLLTVVSALGAKDVIAQDKEWPPFEEAIKKAQEDQRYMMVDIWAPWCGWCKKLQKEVYPELYEYLSDRFILTRINRDNTSRKRLPHRDDTNRAPENSSN